jgi:hypothetical protein
MRLRTAVGKHGATDDADLGDIGDAVVKAYYAAVGDWRANG